MWLGVTGPGPSRLRLDVGAMEASRVRAFSVGSRLGLNAGLKFASSAREPLPLQPSEFSSIKEKGKQVKCKSIRWVALDGLRIFGYHT